MLNKTLPIGILLVSALLGAGAFSLMVKNTAVVTYSHELYEGLEISGKEYGGEWEPNFGNGSMSLQRNFLVDDTAVSFRVTTYLASQPDSELIRYGRSVADPNKWNLVEFSGALTGISSETGVNPNVAIISSKNGLERLATVYWYEVGGRPTASRSLAKLNSITNLFRFREDSTAVVFASTCAEDCEESIEAIKELVARIFLDRTGKYQSVVVKENRVR